MSVGVTFNKCGHSIGISERDSKLPLVCPFCTSQSEADQRDAARYRWLREHHLQVGPDAWIRTGDDLDEAIDAEMKK